MTQRQPLFLNAAGNHQAAYSASGDTLDPGLLPVSSGFELTATGTGSSQTITLPAAATAAQLLVFQNGVKLLPSAYSVSGTTLTITSANGAQLEIILPAGNTGVVMKGFGFSVGANTAASAAIPGVIATNAMSIATGNMLVVVAANPTAAQTWTLKKNSGGTITTLGTIAFATSGAVTISISAFSLAAGDLPFLVGPSAQDATLAFAAQFTAS